MLSLLDGHGAQSPDAYVELLLSEDCLSGKSLLVVEDLVMLAVSGGKINFLLLLQVLSNPYSSCHYHQMG